MNTQPSLEQLDACYKILAIATLDKMEAHYDDYAIEQEAFRIERVVDFYYTYEKHNLHYGEFVKDFIQENKDYLIHRSDYQGDYLGDIPNPSIQEMTKRFFNEDDVEHTLSVVHEQ
jgi:hypothetical protein